MGESCTEHLQNWVTQKKYLIRPLWRMSVVTVCSCHPSRGFFFPLLLILGYTYNWYSLLLICHDWAGMLTYFSDKFNRKGSKKILDNRAKVGKELGRET